jgi:anaerobic magnesium-protoporphyrin IX monomethyl ester cyclase
MTDMRIALVRTNKQSHVISPALGIGYISSYLKSLGHEVKLFDGLRDNISNHQTTNDIIEYCPDYVGITATTAEYRSAIEVAAGLKGIFPLVIGGVHASVLPEQTLKDAFFDYVVVGDGEYAFADILNGHYKPGIVRGCQVADLDAIPWPDWEEINLPKYPREPWGIVTKGWPVGTIMTTRGCPYNCSFCAAPEYTSKTMRYRNPADIVDEMVYLRDIWKVKEINISDDNFTVKRTHAVSVLEEIIDRNLGIPIALENAVRADKVDPELLHLMKKAGVYLVGIGIENPNDRILKLAGKGEGVKQIENAIKWAHEARLETRGCFIVGLPGETKESMKFMSDWARKQPLDEANFTALSILPGSRLWDKKKFEWGSNTFFDVEYAPPGLTVQDVIRGRQHAFRSFYSSPRRFFRIISRLSINQIKHFLDVLLIYRLFKVK